MFQHLELGLIGRSAGYLFGEGMAFTLALTAGATLAGSALGTLLALARSGGPALLARVAGAYVLLLRSLPLVLVIFWVYFLGPYLAQWLSGAPRPTPIGVFASALVTFSLFEAAYFCEIVRGGLRSVAPGQSAAARALGLGPLQGMRWVVLPQALRNMLPVLFTQVVVLFQDVSLVYVLSATDFLGAASKIAHRDGRLVELYLFVALVYLVLCTLASAGVGALQRAGRARAQAAHPP